MRKPKEIILRDMKTANEFLEKEIEKGNTWCKNLMLPKEISGASVKFEFKTGKNEKKVFVVSIIDENGDLKMYKIHPSSIRFKKYY